MQGHFFKIVLLLFISYPLTGIASHCVVSGIAIVPGPWESTSQKISLTLQSQDSSGALCHVAETLRFSLQSSVNSNITGQTGNSLQYFISTNTANRNFYFDNLSGAPFVLNASAGYGSAESFAPRFTTSYSNNEGQASTTETANNEVAQNNPITLNENGTSLLQPESLNASAHFSASSISKRKSNTNISVTAGRDRIGSVGSPLEFRAESDISKTKNSYYVWNFGDGSEGYGEVVTHVYEYPGDYAVILNFKYGDSENISRLNVRIFEPNIKIIDADFEKIILKNNGSNEISLFGKVLLVGDSYFVFPKDTILKPNAEVTFSSKKTGLTPSSKNEVFLFSYGDTERAKMNAKILEEKEKRIKKIKFELEQLKEKINSKDKKVSQQSEKLILNEVFYSPNNDYLVNEISNTKPKVEQHGLFRKIKNFFMMSK